VITNLLEDKKIPVYGDGKNVRDWLYVGDHCRAIDMILTHGQIGETYCIGGMTEDVNNLAVVKKIIRIMGKDESMIEFVKDRPGHDRRYAVDWGKIQRELGWEPEHDFDDWLERTISWYKENTKWWQDIKTGEYKEYYDRHYGKKD
jgi:dTDP-glucose 4,6-dehydratase